MSQSSERLTTPKFTRRRAIQIGLATTGALILPEYLTAPVQAAESSWPFESTPIWYPLRNLPGQITLHEEGGPIDRFDRDFNTHLREEYADYAHWSLEESEQAQKIKKGEAPDDRDSWGYCYAANIADYLAALMRASGETTDEKAAELYRDPNKRGVLAAFGAGYVFVRPHWDANLTPENIQYFLEGMENRNQAFICDINVNKPGRWFHIVRKYNPQSQTVIASGFGYTREFNVASLRLPFLPETVEDAIKNNRDPRMIKETATLRYDDLTRQRVMQFTGLQQ